MGSIYSGSAYPEDVPYCRKQIYQNLLVARQIILFLLRTLSGQGCALKGLIGSDTMCVHALLKTNCRKMMSITDVEWEKDE